MYSQGIGFGAVALFFFTLGSTGFYAFERALAQWEGARAPVVTPVVLSDPKQFPPPEYRHKWAGTSEKLRECEFLDVVWYFGPRDGRKVEVPAFFSDPPKLRGVGVIEFEGIVISLDPEAVTNNSHAYVIHQCPGRFWRTITPFYDSE